MSFLSVSAQTEKLQNLIAGFESFAQSAVDNAAYRTADALRAAAPSALLRAAVYVKTPSESGYSGAAARVRDVVRSSVSIDALQTVRNELPRVAAEIADVVSGSAAIGFAVESAAASNYGGVSDTSSVGWIDRAVSGVRVDISADVSAWLGG